MVAKVKSKYSKGRGRVRPNQGNPLNVDPTRTGMLRASFSREIRRRFAKLRLRITDLIVTQDVLGLITPSPVRNALWSNRAIVEKVRAFQQWLRSQLREIILGVSEDNLWNKYITEGFRKGAGRSFDDVKKAKVPESPLIEVSKVQFLDSAFNHPLSRDKVQLLVSRTFTEMEGITEATAVQMTRVLTDGLVKGKSPKQLASDLIAVSDLSRARAETIARTECLVGETLIDAAMVRTIFRRWYEGPIIEIVTSNGRKLSTTPNHPMLTKKGWVAASVLNSGDYLIRYSRQQGTGTLGNQDIDRGPTPVSQVFDSLNTVGIIERECCAQPDFHGDGMNSYVDVLSTDRELCVGSFSPLNKVLVEDLFSPTDFASSAFCPDCGGLLPVDQRSCFVCGAEANSPLYQSSSYHTPVYSYTRGDVTDRFPRQISLGDAININSGISVVADSPVLPSQLLSLRDSSRDPYCSEDLTNLLLVAADHTSDFPLCHPGEIKVDKILSVTVRPFAGHVFNLETGFGYYLANGYYTGNCIRAFAEGQLDALENLGIEEVGVAVEWSVTKLSNGQIEQKVCKMCRPLEGVVLKLAEARGMLPRHPSCRCAWTPANLGEPTEDQKRTKRQIEAALRRSAKAEKGLDSYGGKGWGPGSKIATTRPKANLNPTDNVLSGSLIEFSNWLSSRG